MATRIVNRTDLVGLTSLSFIREQVLSFNVTGTKPSTRLYAFFDGVDVSKYVTPSGGSLGGAIVTNASGAVSGTFAIPGGTFNTGTRIFLLQDTVNLDYTVIPGAIVGSASASFTATGYLQTWQATLTSINVITNLIREPAPIAPVWLDGPGGDSGDPLAQTFFTYGVVGGCFITKLDLYFGTKDPDIPVRVEIRETVNGYPGKKLVSPYASVTLPSASVNTSSIAATPTTFTFSRPIYLAEDKEYCFVILTNSNAYNVWTSKFGDKSIETDKTIFEQPYIGSLFKSENNITWTAEQTEDIKFTLYKANFSTSPSELTMRAVAGDSYIYGSGMTVTSGSPTVSLRFDYQHGYITGDKLYFTCISTGTYRGITSAAFNNVSGFTLTVVDAYTVSFNVGMNATSSGTLAGSGILNTVLVNSSGSGYVAPTITFSAPPSGTTALGTVSLVGGKIASITITNPGSGYLASPTYTLSETPINAAVLIPISEAVFRVPVSRKYQAANVLVANQQPPQTRLINTLKTSSETYVLGSHSIHELNLMTNIGKDGVVATPTVETASFGGAPSTEVILRLETDNSNVSPLIDLSEKPRIRGQNFLINDTTNAASETASTSGTALARYISKITTLETTSKGVRVLVNASSVNETSFDVFIRTSVAGSTTNHTDGVWVALTCDVTRNRSKTKDEFLDYEFYNSSSMSHFDTYDLKLVMYSTKKYIYPEIANYRAIILAT